MRPRALLLAVLALLASPALALAAPIDVTTVQNPNGSFSYLVNGKPQVFIGMGYNPVYRYLTDAQRAANYRRDFWIMCQAGVNTITGWDEDKFVVQDKFDAITLDTANAYGIGVIMPFYLPPDVDYSDPAVVDDLMAQAKAKIDQYKDNAAIRMWGLGNEVLLVTDESQHDAFLQAYVKIADLFHQEDPNHPVIYREAEDRFIDEIAPVFWPSDNPRPWLLYGMNIYNQDVESIVGRWPSYGLDKPLFISEFGPDGAGLLDRGQDYANMWTGIRAHPDFILGGAPYAWSADGPEPTDAKWGLMNGNSVPVDGAFQLLANLWHKEPGASGRNCSGSL